MVLCPNYYDLGLNTQTITNVSLTVHQPYTLTRSLKTVSANPAKELQNVLPNGNPFAHHIDYHMYGLNCRGLPLANPFPPSRHLNNPLANAATKCPFCHCRHCRHKIIKCRPPPSPTQNHLRICRICRNCSIFRILGTLLPQTRHQNHVATTTSTATLTTFCDRKESFRALHSGLFYRLPTKYYRLSSPHAAQDSLHIEVGNTVRGQMGFFDVGAAQADRPEATA